MKKTLVLTVLGAMLLFTLAAQATTLGYKLDVTTSYQYGASRRGFRLWRQPGYQFHYDHEQRHDHLFRNHQR